MSVGDSQLFDDSSGVCRLILVVVQPIIGRFLLDPNAG